MVETRWLMLTIALFLGVQICVGGMKDPDFTFLSAVRASWNVTSSVPVSWTGGDDNACQWAGITCEDEKLISFNMSKWVPANGWQLPASLQSTNLQRLILPGTKLSGSIPSLPPGLLYLDLASNSLTGALTAFPTTNCKLEEVYLSSNLLSESVPNLVNCPNLRVFDANFNPDLTWVPSYVLTSNMERLSLQEAKNSDRALFALMPSTLVHLNLRDCSLTGTIPVSLFAYNSALKYLDLGGNALGGTLPSTLPSLQSITAVYLDGNQLEGDIPRFLPSLTHLVLNGNLLRGFDPSSDWPSLVTLSAKNNLLSGSIPVGVLRSPDLIKLDLSQNQLTGDVSAISNSLEFVDLSSNLLNTLAISWKGSGLTNLCLQNNSFSGTLPSMLGSKLMELNAEFNYFSGTIPSWTGSKLQALSLANNRLEGPIPSSISGMSALTSLKLQHNALTGSLPSSFPAGLTTLWLDENQLSGVASTSFGNLVNLTSLKLSHNALEGSIAPMVTLPKLETLCLQNNQFVGSLTVPISDQLTTFTVQNNHISGDLPQTFNGEISWLELQNNELTGSLSTAFISTLENMVHLDLGYNRLVGSIADLTAAYKLSFLNLEHNSLEGSIPRLVTGASSGLEYLNIGHNSFSGSINPNMSQLTHLSYLNLEHNQLSGFFLVHMLQLPLRTLQIGHNKFVGTLPPVIAKKPEWPFFDRLDVHSNRMGNSIPEWVGTAGMSYIDLSSNAFTLGIPWFNYTGAYLNVSSNRLSLCDPVPQFDKRFGPAQCDLSIQSVCAQNEGCKGYYEERGCRTTILTSEKCPQPCSSVKPGAGFFCENGAWISTGVNTTGTIIVTGTTTVEGNFTMKGEVVFQAGTSIAVAGCTDFSGTVIVELTEEELELYTNHPGDRVLMTSAQGWCDTGRFGLLGLEVRTPRTCRTVSSSTERVGNSILVHFSVSTKGCTSVGWWKAIIGVLAAVVILVIAAALVFTFNRSARLLVRPYARFDDKGAQELVLANEDNHSISLSEPLLDQPEEEIEWTRNTAQRHLSDMERWRRS